MMTHDLSSNQGWAQAGRIIRGETKDPVTETFERAWKGPQPSKDDELNRLRQEELQRRRDGEKKGPVCIPDVEGRD